jgi:transitional endoplasmic reticulum ATPase
MLKILKTFPPNDELFFTNESQISIVDNKIDQISSSLQSISLEENFTKIIPGLEKVYEALFEVVVYPLLYPDLVQKLKIVCPKGLYKNFSYVYLHIYM